ncbi:MAG: hypothetical protein NTY37_00695 [Methanothrix sp.]|nr:hypothetical protein [Methanothrix sp.]
MQKNLASLICTLALLALLMPATIAEDSQNAATNITLNETQNATGNITQIGAGFAASHTKVLRAGFEKSKPLNNLDVYGNKSTYNIASSTSPSPAFDISQRMGNVSQITYNTDIYKPIYNISQYSRTKPIYAVPEALASKPVYSISGYPKIKAVNGIP